MKFTKRIGLILSTIILIVLTGSFGGCVKLEKVSLSADKFKAAVGESIQFSNDSRGNFNSWSWDFGDGSTSTELNPSHAYNEPGVYYVTLVAFTNNNQYFDTLEVTITGSASGNTLPAATEDLVITLERTPCFGKCPVYSLKIKGDGAVIYAGEEFVKTEGIQESTISEDAIQQLITEFEKADYFSLKDSYTAFGVSDMPFVNTSITIGGKTKAINHYLGDRSAPEQLTKLENKIDEIVNSAQWIK